ncbi:MAG: ABC transporter substrate-binding protein [Saprospiraceae bacterium]
MTSVLNRLQPLSGNKSAMRLTPFSILRNSFLLLFALCLLSSCDALKKVPRDEKKADEDLGEITGGKVYNPKTGKWEEPTTVDAPMDTIAWTEPAEDVAPPITSDDVGDGMSGTPGVGKKKTSYNVAVLLPFMTNNFDEFGKSINQKSELAINLYGGMQLAFDELSSDGVKLNVSVHDTQASASKTKSLLENDMLKEADLIIGPIAKDNLKLVSDFAKAEKKPMVAPLSPSVTITKNNPYYLQISPGLKEHCKTITRHALDDYKAEQLVLVVRNKSAETNRLKYFQEAHQEFEGKSNVEPLKEFIVTDNTVDFSEMDVKPYIQDGKTTVFIIPSWSNESFIYSLMRKISIAKGPNKVVIYGMPQWMKYEQISYDYYENLNLHVSSDTDINPDKEEVKNFKKKFYYKFGSVPMNEAVVGYDLMRYFGNELKRGGTQFQQTIDQNGKDLLHTRINLMPVAPKDAKSEDYSKVERYENQYVNILEFKDYYFQLAE